jgi:hypothetical protein
MRLPVQEVEDLLGLFGKRKGSARRAYLNYVEKGITEGRREELVGGGLVRSAGGWDTVKKLRKTDIRLKGDERILGDTDSIEHILARANEQRARHIHLQSLGFDFGSVVSRVAELLDVDERTVLSRDKTPLSVLARRLLCHFAHNDLGLTTVDIAKLLGLNQSVVSRAARYGREIARQNKYALLKKTWNVPSFRTVKICKYPFHGSLMNRI